MRESCGVPSRRTKSRWTQNPYSSANRFSLHLLQHGESNTHGTACRNAGCTVPLSWLSCRRSPRLWKADATSAAAAVVAACVRDGGHLRAAATLAEQAATRAEHGSIEGGLPRVAVASSEPTHVQPALPLLTSRMRGPPNCKTESKKRLGRPKMQANVSVKLKMEGGSEETKDATQLEVICTEAIRAPKIQQAVKLQDCSSLRIAVKQEDAAGRPPE